MSEFRNVTEVPLDLVVDGSPAHAEPGATVTIRDEFDHQLDFQPSWEPVAPEAVAASGARKALFASDGSPLEASDAVPVEPIKKSRASDDAPAQDPIEGEN